MDAHDRHLDRGEPLMLGRKRRPDGTMTILDAVGRVLRPLTCMQILGASILGCGAAPPPVPAGPVNAGVVAEYVPREYYPPVDLGAPYVGYPFAAVKSTCKIPYHEARTGGAVLAAAGGRIDVQFGCPLDRWGVTGSSLAIFGPPSWSDAVHTGQSVWFTVVGSEGFYFNRHRWIGRSTSFFTLLLMDSNRGLIGGASSNAFVPWPACESESRTRWRAVAVPGWDDLFTNAESRHPLVLADLARWLDPVVDAVGPTDDITWFEGPRRTQPVVGRYRRFEALFYSPAGGAGVALGPGESGILEIEGRPMKLRVVEAIAAPVERRPPACDNRRMGEFMTDTHGPMPRGFLSVVLEPAEPAVRGP